MKDTSDPQVQAALLSFGSAPIDLALPGQEHVDAADRCMAITAATPEYAALSARRVSGEIDGETFASEVMDLMRDLRLKGAFGATA